jgi:heptosyltransferase-1
MNPGEREYKYIALIRLSSLGDIVHTIPAFNILRKQFPSSRITWFAEPSGASLLKYISGIDEIAVLNLKTKGLFNKFKELKRVLSLYRKTFDLVIDFQGLFKSAVPVWLLAGETIGFGKENLKETQVRYFYQRRASRFDENRHVIFKNIHLIRDLLPGCGCEGGCGDADDPVVEYPLEPIPMTPRLKNFLEKNNLEANQYVIINVGGGWESKLMTAAQYSEIIHGLKKHQTVILWGNEKEKQIARDVSGQTGAAMSDFFDFSELILFIRNSRLIVTGDTLPLHLADMVGKPSIGIFGPTSPGRNGSLLEKSISIYENLPCSFCYKKKCDTIDCIKKIDTERVIEAVEKVYKS